MDIRLEKNVYYAGETAKGTLLIKADKSLKVRKVEFSVCRKERYEEYSNYNAMITGRLGGRVEKYDIFFFEDLSPFLKSINSLPYNDDSVVEIPQGSFAIPFH